MAERAIGGIFAENSRLRLRGIDPASPPRVIATDPAGGICAAIGVRADGSARLELQQAQSGTPQMIDIPPGEAPVILNEHF